MSTETRQPQWGECRACSHRWIVLYVPMEAGKAARALKRATCPSCGEMKRLFVYEPGRTPPQEHPGDEQQRVKAGMQPGATSDSATEPLSDDGHAPERPGQPHGASDSLPADGSPPAADVGTRRRRKTPVAETVFVDAGASFSPDGRHRFRLWRTWEYGNGTCVFCMLNPSTANAEVLDPTVAKCVKYAKAWGFGRLEVVNLFAFRGTNPDDLLPLYMADRIGEGNDAAITAACQGAHALAAGTPAVIAAWGVHKAIGDRGLDVLRMLSDVGIPVHALKLAEGGAPCHPLYLKDDLQPRRIELRGTMVRWAS